MTGRAEWAVLFDVDGTMVDNAAYHEAAWVEFGRRNDTPITPAYYRERLHSRSNEQIVRILYGENVSEEEAARVAGEKERIYRDLYRPHVVETPGLLPLLRDLRRARVRMAAASNSPEDNVQLVLQGLGVTGFFGVVIAQAPGLPGKPDPAIFVRAADGLGVVPERCVVVEDSVSGFQAARNAGMPFVVIRHGADPAGLDQTQGACGVYDDFRGVSVADLAKCVS